MEFLTKLKKSGGALMLSQIKTQLHGGFTFNA